MEVKQQKEGNSDGSMRSKSKMNLMKSYNINKKEAEHKIEKQKKENALDIISKSIISLSEGFSLVHINL